MRPARALKRRRVAGMWPGNAAITMRYAGMHGTRLRAAMDPRHLFRFVFQSGQTACGRDTQFALIAYCQPNTCDQPGEPRAGLFAPSPQGIFDEGNHRDRFGRRHTLDRGY